MCFKEKIETIRFFYWCGSWAVPAYSTRHLLHAGVLHGREDCLRPIICRYEFNKCVERYRGHHRVRQFSCWDQMLSHGLRPIDRVGRLARHRGVPAVATRQALLLLRKDCLFCHQSECYGPTSPSISLESIKSLRSCLKRHKLIENHPTVIL